MKKKILIALAVFALLGAGTFSFARTRMACRQCSCRDFVNADPSNHTHKKCICGHLYQNHSEVRD